MTVSKGKNDADVVIVGAARTANGKLLGGLSSLSAVELGATAIRGALEKGRVAPSDVDTVVMGNVLQAGLGQCPARQAAIAAGIGWNVTAHTINRVCLSGLSSVIDAVRMIRLGEAAVAVAGGMESMSNSPHLLPKSRNGYKFGEFTAIDSMMRDGLSDAWSGESMGLDTERHLAEYSASREEQDEVSARSHRLAAAAWDAGAFDDEVIPIMVRQGRKQLEIAKDEGIRPTSTAESLGGLPAAFQSGGTITAGNSSSINDGGAALVLTTRGKAIEKDWEVLTTVRSSAQMAGPSSALAPQPAAAVERALQSEGWTVGDLDLLEINEAFAAVMVYSVRRLGVSMDIVNIHGGAIALGHPIGQSGARLVVHMAHELHRRGSGRAAVALCGGTGQGDALLLEN